MATTTFNISDELLPSVNSIVKEFNFESKEEFFQEAVRDKVLELKKKLFFQGSNKIAENLNKKKIKEKDILNEFNKRVHS
ncbi:hypothetical protein HON71_03375 [Candidatus Woesearchaeota archaeon]|jgi:hypothetical protein|nr:hypothetical protein [Candidatus Woesearchaeota archaeon]MBT5343066.1 hypothetical protein [Candidatus Woesearchaeota archaeon]